VQQATETGANELNLLANTAATAASLEVGQSVTHARRSSEQQDARPSDCSHPAVARQ